MHVMPADQHRLIPTSEEKKCEEGDLNPVWSAKILRKFNAPTAKNRQLPPSIVPAGDNLGGVGEGELSHECR